MARKHRPKRAGAPKQHAIQSNTRNNGATPDMDGPFRFLELPAEVRNEIYSYLMPTKRSLVSSDSWMHDKLLHTLERDWTKPVSESGGEAAEPEGTISLYTDRADEAYTPRLHPQIFAVNKQISQEALVLLLRSNTFEFRLHSYHPKRIIRSVKYVPGPFNFYDQVDLISNLRKVKLCATLYNSGDTRTHSERVRSRVLWIADALAACNTDDNGDPLLQELTISLKHTRDTRPWAYYDSAKIEKSAFIRQDKYMACFESLARLSCGNKIEIEGLPDWFTQCLKLRMAKKGGPLKTASWKLKWMKRQRDFKSRKVRCTTKKWYYPEFDWKEFAERNGITIPKHYDWLNDIE